MEEIWKEIPYFPKYRASTFGRVCGPRGLLAQSTRNRYACVTLHDIDGKAKTTNVHRIIARVFISNPESKPLVNHLNGIKQDNRVENLEWCTDSENKKHAYKQGLKSNCGEKSSQHKLTAFQVRAIREAYSCGVKQVRLAEKYCMAPSTINQIVKRLRWQHI